jgi:heat-inducible transcriptional repressor
MEVGRLAPEERAQIDAQIAGLNRDKTTDDILADATNLLSGLSSCAGLVLTSKQNVPGCGISSLSCINPSKALVIMVSEDGSVENRTIEIPRGLPPSTLNEVSNFLNSRCQGLTLGELRQQLGSQLETVRQELDSLAARVIEAGLAVWSDDDGDGKRSLIVRGRSNLIAGQHARRGHCPHTPAVRRPGKQEGRGEPAGAGGKLEMVCGSLSVPRPGCSRYPVRRWWSRLTVMPRTTSSAYLAWSGRPG